MEMEIYRATTTWAALAIGVLAMVLMVILKVTRYKIGRQIFAVALFLVIMNLLDLAIGTVTPIAMKQALLPGLELFASLVIVSTVVGVIVSKRRK